MTRVRSVFLDLDPKNWVLELEGLVSFNMTDIVVTRVDGNECQDLRCGSEVSASALSSSRGWQVRVPAGVDDERVLQPAQAVQHHDGRRQPRLQGIRHRHSHRLSTQVSPSAIEPHHPDRILTC